MSKHAQLNLAFKQKVDFPDCAAPFTARDHFQAGEDGLWICNGFKKRVLSATGSAKTTPAMKGASFNLLKSMIDENIRAGLPKGHTFDDVDVLCSHLKGMLKGQAGGKPGPLLTNGTDSLFYVQVAGEVFAVIVRWYADIQTWIVDARRLNNNIWGVGYRVFSAAAVA